MRSIVEFLVNEGPLSEDEVNDLFEYHSVGYRLATNPLKRTGQVVVHYNSVIEDVQIVLESEIKYKGVKANIESARRILINPKEISLANSIKNSIDAVEGYLKGFLLEKGIKCGTLGDCIKKCKNSEMFPINILNALEQFYVLRNRTPNAGHGDPNLADEIERHEALLCLEVAVSFINYFHRKREGNS